jgi:hypothetical protein
MGIVRHRLTVEAKPIDGFHSGSVNAHVFHFGNEVQNVAAMVTFAETVPDILAHTDSELRRIAAFVDRAGTAQAVSAPFESVEKTVMLEQLLHGDGRFNGLEINKR